MNIGGNVRYNSLKTVPVSNAFRLSASYKVTNYLNLLTGCNDFGAPTLFLTFSSNLYGWDSISDYVNLVNGENRPVNNEPVLYA